MNAYDQRTDNLKFLGYWKVSRKLDSYAAAFVDTSKVNSLVLYHMNGIGNLSESPINTAYIKQVGNDLRVCYDGNDDIFSIGGKGAVFNKFTLVNKLDFRWTESDIIHFGENKRVRVYNSKEV